MAISEEAKLLVRVEAQNATRAAFQDIERGLGRMRDNVLKVGAAIGSAFALKDVIDSTREWGRQIDLLQDDLGLTAEAASQLNFVARSVGLSTDELATAFASLNRKLVDQLPLIVKGQSDFDKFGVEVRDAGGNILSFENVLQNVRQRFAELGPGTLRTAAAMELFGRSGRQLNDFLALSQDEIAELTQEAAQFGLVLDERGSATIETFNRNLRRFELQLQGIKMALGNLLLPVLNAVLVKIREGAGLFKAFGEAMRAPLGIIKEVAERIRQFASELKERGVMEAVLSLARDIMSKVGEVLAQAGQWVATNAPLWIAAFGDLIGGVVNWLGSTGWPSLVGFVEENAPRLARWIVDTIPVWLGNFGQLLGDATRWFIGTFIPGLAGALAEFIPKLSEWGRNVSSWFFTQGAPAILGGAVRMGLAIVDGILEGMADLGAKLLDKIRQTILSIVPPPLRIPVELFLGGLPEWLRERTVPALDLNRFLPRPSPAPPRGSFTAPGANLPCPPGFVNMGGTCVPIPSLGGGGAELFSPLAHGGIVTRPTHALLAESGPEAVIPLDRAGGFGAMINHFHIGSVDSRERVDELADAVAARFMQFTRARRQFHLGTAVTR